MSSRPWMPFYIADFRAKTIDLDAAEKWTYLEMLSLAWQREDAALPADIKWLKQALKCSIANFHGHQFNRIVPKILERYWVHCADGKFRNKRLTEEYEKMAKRSTNGRQNADKRWSETRKINDLKSDWQCYSHTHSKERAERPSPTYLKVVGEGSKKGPALGSSGSSLQDVMRKKGWVP